jgi:hypothetical protein
MSQMNTEQKVIKNKGGIRDRRTNSPSVAPTRYNVIATPPDPNQRSNPQAQLTDGRPG